MADGADLIPMERIAGAILLLRGQKVMLDSDLAELYGVETRVLVQAVKRNSGRFPPDFMFQLTWEETTRLRSQSVILNESPPHRGRHTKYPPYAFTEQGVAMLSSVLRSERAIAVNVAIMRAFVRLRQALATHEDLARRLEELQVQVAQQGEQLGEHGEQLAAIVAWIQEQIAGVDAVAYRRIGFRSAEWQEQ